MTALRNPTRREQLDSILEMSLSMLDLARDGQWGALESLESRRRILVADCFREPAGAEESDMMADYIGRLLDVNREISALTEAARDDIGSHVRTLGTGRQARQAYRQHF